MILYCGLFSTTHMFLKQIEVAAPNIFQWDASNMTGIRKVVVWFLDHKGIVHNVFIEQRKRLINNIICRCRKDYELLFGEKDLNFELINDAFVPRERVYGQKFNWRIRYCCLLLCDFWLLQKLKTALKEIRI